MNNIDRIKKLSGISGITESAGEKKYADRDKAGLLAVKKELQAVMAHAARASFKYKNAAEELKVVEDCLKKLDDTEKKEVKESEQILPDLNGETILDEQEGVEDSGNILEGKDDLWVLKVGEPDSDKMGIQFSGTRKECVDEWNDTKHSWPKGSKHKIERHVEESATAPVVEAEKEKLDYLNAPVENSGIKVEQGTKIHLPSAVKAAVKSRISELNHAILAYDDKGYDDKSIKQQAVDCLNQIMQDIGDGSIEGVKKAQVYFETLMSPLTDFFPPQIINWLANALNPYVKMSESFNKDFSADDDIGNMRLDKILNKLEELLQFVNPEDVRANNAIASWVQSNVGKAFWISVSEWLLDKGFDGASSAVQEYAHESGY